jgi:hypothetical protein
LAIALSTFAAVPGLQNSNIFYIAPRNNVFTPVQRGASRALAEPFRARQEKMTEARATRAAPPLRRGGPRGPGPGTKVFLVLFLQKKNNNLIFIKKNNQKDFWSTCWPKVRTRSLGERACHERRGRPGRGDRPGGYSFFISRKIFFF